jgi:hypothetical protein
VDSDTITVVSGLPRSGTSMMMKMLEAGGLTVLTDNQRVADEDNPKGYYEDERIKRLAKDASWLGEARGKVVKVVSPLLRHLRSEFRYRIVFVRRDMAEVLASQRQMLVRRSQPTDAVSDDQMAAAYGKHLAGIEAWLEEQPNIDVLYVTYKDVVASPAEHAERINQFLGRRLDPASMVAAVDRTLYRQQRR